MSVPEFRLKSILVPVDFSGPAEAALRNALTIAERFEARITLIHVIESHRLTAEFAELGTPAGDIPKAVKKRLAALAGRFDSPSHFDTEAVRIGRPEYEIGFAARELESDLTVITTHGYTGLDYVLLGGTAEQIARHTTSPVMVLRKQNSHKLDLKKILAPVSLCPESLNGLRYACGFAKPFGAAVTALHAIEPLGPLARFEVNKELHEKKLRAAANWHLDVMHVEVEQPPEAFDTLLKEGTPYHEIIETARTDNFDLIVMAALRRSGLGDMFLGGTIEHVLRHAPCPVLIVRGANPHPEASAASQ
jgi:nucleotide-binding universal stress UspA family protein